MPHQTARSSSAAVLWQGFNHAWAYNHRLNRFGSYVRCDAEGDGHRTVIGHTAASGTGGDVAHFSDLVTILDAPGVAFQEGTAEATVECPRAVTTPFRIKVDRLDLAPEMVGKERYTVLLNGFDLFALRHADKLIAFELEVSEPTVTASERTIRFHVFGQLCFDCRTAECQLWPVSLEMELDDRHGSATSPPAMESPQQRGIPNRPAFEQGINWLKRQIARFTDLENVKRSVVGRDEDRLRRRLFRLLGRQFYLRVAKWRILSPYRLRVHYLIIGSNRQALHITETDTFHNTYAWDAETEIHQSEVGRVPITVAAENPSEYELSTFGFKQLSLSTEMDQDFGSSNPIQWGKGMHLLEWHMALRDIETRTDSVAATLDLFYKSWSEAMNKVITFTTWGAVRSAGTATLTARLALLQFKQATLGEQRILPGRMHWPGAGLSARSDPRAIAERVVEPVDQGEEASGDP